MESHERVRACESQESAVDVVSVPLAGFAISGSAVVAVYLSPVPAGTNRHWGPPSLTFNGHRQTEVKTEA